MDPWNYSNGHCGPDPGPGGDDWSCDYPDDGGEWPPWTPGPHPLGWGGGGHPPMPPRPPHPGWWGWQRPPWCPPGPPGPMFRPPLHVHHVHHVHPDWANWGPRPAAVRQFGPASAAAGPGRQPPAPIVKADTNAKAGASGERRNTAEKPAAAAAGRNAKLEGRSSLAANDDDASAKRQSREGNANQERRFQGSALYTNTFKGFKEELLNDPMLKDRVGKLPPGQQFTAADLMKRLTHGLVRVKYNIDDLSRKKQKQVAKESGIKCLVSYRLTVSMLNVASGLAVNKQAAMEEAARKGCEVFFSPLFPDHKLPLKDGDGTAKEKLEKRRPLALEKEIAVPLAQENARKLLTASAKASGQLVKIEGMRERLEKNMAGMSLSNPEGMKTFRNRVIREADKLPQEIVKLTSFIYVLETLTGVPSAEWTWGEKKFSLKKVRFTLDIPSNGIHEQTYLESPVEPLTSSKERLANLVLKRMYTSKNKRSPWVDCFSEAIDKIQMEMEEEMRAANVLPKPSLYRRAIGAMKMTMEEWELEKGTLESESSTGKSSTSEASTSKSPPSKSSTSKSSPTKSPPTDKLGKIQAVKQQMSKRMTGMRLYDPKGKQTLRKILTENAAPKELLKLTSFEFVLETLTGVPPGRWLVEGVATRQKKVTLTIKKAGVRAQTSWKGSDEASTREELATLAVAMKYKKSNSPWIDCVCDAIDEIAPRFERDKRAAEVMPKPHFRKRPRDASEVAKESESEILRPGKANEEKRPKLCKKELDA